MPTAKSTITRPKITHTLDEALVEVFFVVHWIIGRFYIFSVTVHDLFCRMFLVLRELSQMPDLLLICGWIDVDISNGTTGGITHPSTSPDLACISLQESLRSVSQNSCHCPQVPLTNSLGFWVPGLDILPAIPRLPRYP